MIMAKNIPDWEQLEIIVADIQKQLAPNAEVRHNHIVTGKSGRKRKLDVTVSQKVGTSPVFIVFDCKHHNKKVKLKDVAAFFEQLEDVGASLGVMVSNLGFDAGAKAVAERKSILLQIYRKAGEIDWKSLLGEQAWGILTEIEVRNLRLLATLSADKPQKAITFKTQIYDENGERLGTFENNFWEMWKQLGQPTGNINGNLFFEGQASFIQDDDKLLQIQSATISAQLVPIKYMINWQLSHGDIIESSEQNQPVYRSLASQGIDWAEIVNNKPGIEITSEEYQQIVKDLKLMVDLSKAKRFIRLVAQDKGNQKD